MERDSFLAQLDLGNICPENVFFRCKTYVALSLKLQDAFRLWALLNQFSHISFFFFFSCNSISCVDWPVKFGVDNIYLS